MAQRRSKDVSRLRAGDALVVNGEYEIEGRFEMRQLSEARLGSLVRQEYVVEADYAEAQYTVLSAGPYLVDWGSYCLREGLAYYGETDDPFVELHFQLEGDVRAVRSSLGVDFHLQAGENNMVYVPAVAGHFELGADSRGAVFEVQLSVPYVQALAERHPALVGALAEKMVREEAFWLRASPVRTTPAMRAVIEAIRSRPLDHAAAGLLLESQLLELFALQLVEAAAVPPQGGAPLSRSEVDRLYEARDVLLGQMTEPPTLAELARRVGTNEFSLKRGFRTLFGTSPYALLLDHKLEKARRLLLDTRLTVAEVAYQVGYTHPAHFTNAFRKRYGIRPRDLR